MPTVMSFDLGSNIPITIFSMFPEILTDCGF